MQFLIWAYCWLRAVGTGVWCLKFVSFQYIRWRGAQSIRENSWREESCLKLDHVKVLTPGTSWYFLPAVNASPLRCPSSGKLLEQKCMASERRLLAKENWMWWCSEKADTRSKYRVLVLGCLRWDLHGPGCVPLTLSSGQDSIWYGLQSWALCIPFEGSMLMYDRVFYSGKVMGELRIQLYRLSTISAIIIIGYELFPCSSSTGCLGVLQ